MPILEKIRRIFNSNINDLLDRVEDPGKDLESTLGGYAARTQRGQDSGCCGDSGWKQI